jgi:hypothetical protein
MADELIIASTTDTEEEIRAALTPREETPAPLAEVDRTTGQVTEPPAEVVAPEAAETPEEATAEPAKPKPKKSRSEERIHELTREKYLAQRRAEKLEQELAAYRTAVQQQAPPPVVYQPPQAQAPPPQAQPQGQPPPSGEGKPQVGQFHVYEDFVDALAQWNARQVAREQIGQLRAEDAMAVVQAQQQQILTQFEAAKQGARDRYGDFDDVMTSEVATSMPLSEAMQHVITTSPVGHDVAYYLVQHPDEAQQLVQQAPLDALRSLGRLEERLSAQLRVQYGGNGGRAPVQARVTRAATPIEPIGGAAATTGVPDDQLSYREYKAKRDREEFDRRRSRR